MGRGRPQPEPLPTAPDCNCGATPGASHARECNLVAYALGRVVVAPKAEDGLGRAKGKPKTGSTWRGVWVASELERDVLEELDGIVLRARRLEGRAAWIIRQPHFDLWSSWKPGMGKPLQFTPDALVVYGPRTPRATLEVLAGHRLPGPGEKIPRVHEADLARDVLQVVEIHEAKGPRKLESRDYRPRLAAFRATYPSWPVFVWRKAKGQLVVEQLADLKEDTDGEG